MTFAQVRKLMKHAALEPHGLAARLVYAYILEQGEGAHSLRTLSAELGITTVTAKNALDGLLEAGLIAITEPSRGRRAAVIIAIELK